MEHDFQTNSEDENPSNAFGRPPADSSTLPTSPAPSDRVTEVNQKLFTFVRGIFIGDHGLRGGWSIVIFLIVVSLATSAVGFLYAMLHITTASRGGITVRAVLILDSMELIGLIVAASVVAVIERRRVLDFNLTGPQPTKNFLAGLLAGFIALSLLVGALWSGGWLQFSPASLSGQAIARYAVLWGVAFLLVGCVEEGVFRCFLQFTFTRSVNFWWALAVLGLTCVSLVLRAKPSAAWGVYAIALIGLIPCLLLELKRTPNSGFWQAAWVTSTLFGAIHLSNNGENWIGIFAAAAIGFVFCVSVWVTGSAWWAIGCHAGWDWGETYFYGTADSGMVAPGHYLSTNPFGNPFWSGGSNGPEGSILVLGAILLLLVWLLVIFGRKGKLPNQGTTSAVAN